MATWAFYSDAALSSALTELSCTQTTSTFKVWFGSTTSGYKLIPATSGATGILVTCADSTSGGHAITAIKMASGTGGLAGASGGASWDLGAAVIGGASNAESWYIQITDAVGDGAKDQTLSLAIKDSAGGGLYQTAT
jgi:hypothetical protein